MQVEHESKCDTSDLEEPDKWTVDTHTKTVPTDAFGEMQFAGSTMQARKVGLLLLLGRMVVLRT